MAGSPVSMATNSSKNAVTSVAVLPVASLAMPTRWSRVPRLRTLRTPVVGSDEADRVSDPSATVATLAATGGRLGRRAPDTVTTCGVSPGCPLVTKSRPRGSFCQNTPVVPPSTSVPPHIRALSFSRFAARLAARPDPTAASRSSANSDTE